jgi:dienelactone hydrolase
MNNSRIFVLSFIVLFALSAFLRAKHLVEDLSWEIGDTTFTGKLVVPENATEVDWRLIAYGAAVHSFINPYANSPGTSQYHETAARRSLAAMRSLLDEVWTE